MKKSLPVWLLVLSLCACSQAPGASPPARPETAFSSRISIEADGKSFGGTWDGSAEGILVLTLSYPQTVGGTAYSCDGASVTVSSAGISHTMSLDELPKEGPPRLLFEIFRLCAVKDALSAPVFSDDAWLFSGDCFGDAFTVFTDAGGKIETIAIDSKNLQIGFLYEE